jgi:hypothetical protein
MPNEGERENDANAAARDRTDGDNAENDDSAVRRELYTTKKRILEPGSASAPASRIRPLPPPIVAPPPFTHHFKLFHLDLLEHLYEKEMDPRHVASPRNGSKDAEEASSSAATALRTELSMARTFLNDLPELVARRAEATRLVKIHEEAENLCVAPDNAPWKRRKTTNLQASNSRADHRGGGGRERESSSNAHASAPPMLSPSFRIVEHLLIRQAEHAANAWSCRQASSVTPLLTMVRRRIEALQGVQKDRHDKEKEDAQRLIDQLLSTNPKRKNEANESPAEERNVGIKDDSWAMTTSLKLRLWDLLRRDLESLSVHAECEIDDQLTQAARCYVFGSSA